MSASNVMGQTITDFSAASTQGTLTLQDLKGRWTVLYFYPKDSTPGCTTQAQDFRDLVTQFQVLDCRVIGVSRDSLKSHENFAAKQGFTFALISDPEETLCEQFGVMKMKNLYGKQSRGVERSTFLIDPEGVLAHEWRGVRVPGHVQDVLETLRQILKNAPSGSAA